jgi:anti-sigma factor RsiW
MKCEDVAKQMIPYLDGRSKEADRTAVDQHLAGCAECRARSQELFTLWKTMDELPAVAPSFGFDARMRQRIAAEPRRSWFTAFIPQPRLALSAAMLIALSVWVVKMPASHPVATPVSTVAATQQEDFNAIQNLGVLENYDVVTKMDALSQLVPDNQQQPSDQQHDQDGDNNGGA